MVVVRIGHLCSSAYELTQHKHIPEDKTRMRSWNLYSKRSALPREYASLALQVIENPYLNTALLRLDSGARV
ncbi:hypothetical protein [Aromatoleum petrolei]|uniref:Uncharacterized protein n=1 Tax=Aromatoleum petrolei TaxID=76116 RepID=A0ABX1MPG6_9RHOO|nr:hypothetical protein [Aromatoleum petrolei]NMF88591.1 hypothetical protein [Aromatoleum petrolei]QTQ34702.1 Uncharacterized protein ToN1_05290 [Aromatoleum petrolei]